MNTQANLYKKDFYSWTIDTVNKLKKKQFNQIDITHLMEEVESMGASERNQLQSRLEVLLMHLLKWQYQSIRRSRSWTLTIEEQRKRLKRLLAKMPSLKSCLQEEIFEAYDYAILKAAKETNLEKSTFPTELPYTLEQILNEEYYPE